MQPCNLNCHCSGNVLVCFWDQSKVMVLGFKILSSFAPNYLKDHCCLDPEMFIGVPFSDQADSYKAEGLLSGGTLVMEHLVTTFRFFLFSQALYYFFCCWSRFLPGFKYCCIAYAGF